MRFFLFILTILLFNISHAQPDSLYIKEVTPKYTGPLWTQKKKISLDLSEVAFANWNAGGTNSISGLLGFKYILDYKDAFYVWKSTLEIRHGINKQEARELRKTDDLFEISSKIGYRPNKHSNWFYSAKFNFRTQLTNGYNYPDKTRPISRLLAPGYLFFGGGTEYGKYIDKFSLYLSPLTLKATFVLDSNLANAGSFGVTPAVFDDEGNVITPGQRVRKEVGILITNGYEFELAKNVNVKSQVSLYSDYINNFGNLDLDWRIDFDFKVNSFIRATFGSHLRYDDDVKTEKPSEIEGQFDKAGAKVQLKQFLGIGFAVDF